MKIGRNEPCPCGSGKKYKKCCINSDLETLNRIRHEEIHDIIDEFVSVEISFFFKDHLENENWELLRSPNDEEYRVYIKYDDRQYIDMAILGDHEYITSLTDEKKESIKENEGFLFKFLFSMQKMEDTLGKLNKEEREMVSDLALEKY